MEGIATQLLTKGECVVAGEECIWKGGVGNFIKTKELEDSFGCLVYKLDVESFVKSCWVQEEKKSVYLARMEESDIMYNTWQTYKTETEEIGNL